MIRRILGILFAVALVCVMAGLVARHYLKSRRVVDNVVAQLETIYPGKIKLESVDIGLGSTSFKGLELLEADGKTPWLAVEDMQTDISLRDYLQGNAMPTKIKLSGARMLLRFSSDGKLLSCLPDQFCLQNTEEYDEESALFNSMPTIELDNCQLTIRTEGLADLVLHNMQGKLDKANDQIVLTAAVENRHWGIWTITGLFHKEKAAIGLQFKTRGSVHVTQAMLDQLPFVPAGCWRAVQIRQADTPALVRVEYDLRQNSFHYRAELAPVGADLCIKAIHMEAANARGKMFFEDNQLLLRDLRADVFSGTLRGAADLTFDAEAVRIDTRFEVDHLLVSQFPESWKLPQLTGKLNGVAALQVVVTPAHHSAAGLASMVGLAGSPLAGPGQLSSLMLGAPEAATIRTDGKGKGQIVDAVIPGELKVRTIDLELRPVPGGFRFGNQGRMKVEG